MRTFADLADALNGITSDVVALQTAENARSAAMQLLQQQLATANLSPDQQKALDAAVDQANQTKAAMDMLLGNLKATSAAATTAAGGNTSGFSTGNSPNQSGPITPPPVVDAASIAAAGSAAVVPGADGQQQQSGAPQT